MVHDRKVVSISGRQSPGQEAPQLPPALVRLRDTSGRSLRTVMAGAFERADDALFELAERAASNKDQTAYFDAMRELRLRRSAIVASVLQYVARAFNEIGRFRPRPGAEGLESFDQDSLSLLEHSELEQQVAIDSLIAKLKTHHAEPIRLLTVRVNHLLPHLKLADSQMPLSPDVICGGIAGACADLDIDIRAKLVVLKLFDRLLVDRLAQVYQTANATLVAEGVLPDMKHPPLPSAVSVSTSRTAPSGSHGSSGLAPGTEPGAQPTFSELTELLRSRDGATTAAGAATSAGTAGVLDTADLLERLTEAQQQIDPGAADRVVPLADQLEAALQTFGGRSWQLRQVDSDVINLVSMLFDFILEDRQLHPVMKALIGRLQIPVLKVALTDRNFFNKGGHPVRKLLNELASAAIGWTEKPAGQRDPLRNKIETVVSRVLSEFTDDVGLFDELLRDFARFLDLDRRRRELVEQRLRDMEEGRARQERAAKLAENLLSESCREHEIPEEVANLLNEAWKRYLQWVLLREGESGARWQRACELTRKLIWSVDPRPVTAATRSELLRAIPGIVDDLRQALQDISWDPFATDAAIRDLELAHVDMLQRLEISAPSRSEPGTDTAVAGSPQQSVADAGPAADAGPEAVPEPSQPDAGASPAGTADVSVAPVPETAPPQAAVPAPEWLKQADALRVGSWLELTRERGKVRCKLAAFIRSTGKYIFVNRSGAKVAEYGREELALALASGEVVLLDDGQIFDRALESIIDNLRASRRD